MLKKKVKKNHDYLKTILFSIWFSHAPRNIFSSKKSWLKSGPKRKKPVKTHIEALKILKFLGGDPLTPHDERGSPPLVPSALDDFLHWTTFKYAATALVYGGLNQYKIVVPLFGAAYAAPNKGTIILHWFSKTNIFSISEVEF